MKSQKIIPNQGEQQPIYEGYYSWTVSDVASAFKISRRTVADWQKQKRIPYLKAGKLVRFNPREVNRALDKFVIHSAY